MTVNNKPPVEETTKYDNYMDKDGEIRKDVENEDSFQGMFDVKGNDEPEWKKHWTGMPEFEQEDNPPYRKINVSFRTKEAFEEFQEMIDQKMTDKTKSIWHPKLDKSTNSLFRWIEDEE